MQADGPNRRQAVLVALVSLGRLEAWVAMVIIAREFAVTVLRVAVGTQQGMVISANLFCSAS
jgi:CDP-diacylglycerol---glycerol-3-phosphate 3-phosphatidyltransferase